LGCNKKRKNEIQLLPIDFRCPPSPPQPDTQNNTTRHGQGWRSAEDVPSSQAGNSREEGGIGAHVTGNIFGMEESAQAIPLPREPAAAAKRHLSPVSSPRSNPHTVILSGPPPKVEVERQVRKGSDITEPDRKMDVNLALGVAKVKVSFLVTPGVEHSLKLFRYMPKTTRTASFFRTMA
jgi:hypothetical protein